MPWVQRLSGLTVTSESSVESLTATGFEPRRCLSEPLQGQEGTRVPRFTLSHAQVPPNVWDRCAPHLVSPLHEFWHVELTGTGAYDGQAALLYVQAWATEPKDIEGFVFPGALPHYPNAIDEPAE